MSTILGFMFGFLGVLLAFALLLGLGYAIVNKKRPSVRTAVVLIVIVLIIIGLWGLWSARGTLSQFPLAPSMRTVWETTKEYWLWILIAGGIASVLPKTALTNRLWITLGAVMFLLFVVAPIGSCVTSPSKPPSGGDESVGTSLPQVTCPDVSAYETRGCILNTAWSSRLQSADGPGSIGMQVCSTPGGQFERTEQYGVTYWRYRADYGRLLKQYRLFPADQECPQSLPP